MITQEFVDQYGENGWWNEHPEYTRIKWMLDIYDSKTQKGYWEWVVKNLENRIDEINKTIETNEAANLYDQVKKLIIKQPVYGG